MNDKGIIVKSLYGVLLLWCISTGARAQIDAPGYPLASGISQTPAHMESGDIVYRQLNPEVPYGGGTGVNRLLSDALASFGGYHVGSYNDPIMLEKTIGGYTFIPSGLITVRAYDGAGNFMLDCGARSAARLQAIAGESYA